tara:strand:+ start:185 stop:949 length:765 start_codon:yes stop_codon:yes gene_type:complete
MNLSPNIKFVAPYLGAIIGYFLGNFIGAAAAFLLTRELLNYSGVNTNKTDHKFELALLKLSSLLIKADGKVDNSEKQYVKDYFVKNFGKSYSNELFRRFKEIDMSDDILELTNIVKASISSSKYYTVLYYLYSIAASDGIIDSREDAFILKVAKGLNLESRYDFIRSQFVKNDSRKKDSGKSTTKSTPKISQALSDLGLKDGATKEEIKSAYRKLAKEFHPDKLAGMSEGIINLAKGKFQKIVGSYEYLIKNYV